MNQVVLIGRLGKDVELHEKGETKWAKFSLATNEYSKGGDVTSWHNVTAFDKTAENCAKFLSKGAQVAVVGSIRYDQYEQDGIVKYSAKIIANRVEFLETKKKDETPVDF